MIRAQRGASWVEMLAGPIIHELREYYPDSIVDSRGPFGLGDQVLQISIYSDRLKAVRWEDALHVLSLRFDGQDNLEIIEAYTEGLRPRYKSHPLPDTVERVAKYMEEKCQR